MAALSVLNLFKRSVNNDGSLGNRVPAIVKTLASYVFLNDGRTVESAITSLDSAPRFATLAAYQTAIANGTVSPNRICVITSDVTSNS